MSDSPRQSVQFVVDLLKQVYQTGHNLVISPYSLTSALSMLLVGTDGNTRLELAKALFDTNSTKPEDADKHVLEFTRDNKALILTSNGSVSIKNFLYLQNSFPLKPEFESTVVSNFEGIIKSLDFASENAAALNKINSDAEQATNGMIKQLINKISPSTRLILMNVVYFKGIWKSIFEESDTNENGEFFKTSGQVVKNALMSQKGRFLMFYDEKSKTKAVELRYDDVNGKDIKMSMLLILPGEGVSLESFIRSLTAQQLNHILSNFKRDWQIRLIVPRFKMSLKHQLVPVLKSLNIEDLFDDFKADLGGISPQAQGLFVSEVIQKCVIELNELGTEASAGTWVEASAMCAFGYVPPKYVDFIFNRPFLYVLVSADGPKQVLFIGAVEDPTAEN